MFGEITFTLINGERGEGIYDGRKFVVLAEEDDAEGLVYGDFDDEERLFIFTQWTIRQ